MKKFRAIQPRGFTGKVDRDAKTIEDVAVCTAGEARGHGLWLDREFIASVAMAGNNGGRTIRCRFSHPNLCSDGTGNILGKFDNFKLSEDGKRVTARLNLLDAADESPKGKLASYVMAMAEESPDLFGTSIVFERDEDAEEKFKKLNLSEDSGHFVSPEVENENDYCHARLGKLTACDVVDEPAANPNGFFSDDQERAVMAALSLDYIFGIAPNAPAGVEMLGVDDPERVRDFVKVWLARNSLEVRKMEKEITIPGLNPAVFDASLLAEIAGDSPRLGQAIREKWSVEKLTATIEADAILAKANAEIETLRAQLSAKPSHGVPPVGTGPTNRIGTPTTSAYLARVKQLAEERKITFGAAVKFIADNEPELAESAKIVGLSR